MKSQQNRFELATRPGFSGVWWVDDNRYTARYDFGNALLLKCVVGMGKKK